MRNRLLAMFGGMAVLVIACLAFAGCAVVEKEDGRIRDLEFTVVGEKQVPEELQRLIAEKKAEPFKLTYADGQEMYIVVGEGAQDGGGFSVAVRELYLTENSVVMKSEMMGPDAGSEKGSEKSFPVLIVKTEFLEEPVVFK